MGHEFKAGDRVKCVEGYAPLGLHTGSVYRVSAVKVHSDGSKSIDVGTGLVMGKRFIADPIPATPEKTQKPALVLQVGKAYRARNGERVTIFDQRCESRGYIAGRDQRGSDWYQVDGGKFLNGSRPDLDLIAEWSDEPAATPAPVISAETPKFKVGDRVVTERFEDFETGWVSAMDEMVGKAGRITKQAHHREDEFMVHGWWWPASALRLAPASSTPTPEPAPDFPGLKRIREIRESNATRAVSVDDVRAFVKAGQAADPNAAMLARDAAAIARIQPKPAKPITQSTAERLAELQREQAASAAQAERDRIATNLTKF